MSSAEETDQLTSLIERLVVDPAFRARFRRDPIEISRAFGLDELAEEFGAQGTGIHTLELRESKSSLAGVVMAIAAEGIGLAEVRGMLGHGPGHAAALKALKGAGVKTPSGGAAGIAKAAGLHGVPGAGAHGNAAHAVLPQPVGGAGHAAPAAAAPASTAAPAGTPAPANPVVPEAPAAPPAAVHAAPAGGVTPAPAPDPTAGPAPASPAAAGAAAAAAGPAPVSGGGGAASAVDATQPAPAGAGAAGAAAAAAAMPSGGSTAAAAAQLLANPNLSVPASARALFASGSADPRLLSVLSNAASHHTIVLGDAESVVDPVHAQAVDIVAVDGQPVGPANVAARDLITEIAALDPSVRPREIGTPWPIESPGFFTDPAQAGRLHLAFVSPADFQPGAGGAGAAAAGVGPAPATPAAAGAAQAAGAALAQAPATPAGVPVADQAAAGVGGGGAGVPDLPSAGGRPMPQGGGGGAAAALAYARSMIGKLPESAGNNLGPQLDNFEAEFGYHGAPWCGIFVGHALQAAGLKVPHTVASVAAILDLARSGDGPFQKGILPVSAIRPGDLVTFGGTEHVAIVTRVDAAGIHTIAGNTGQSNVSETTYSPSSVTGVVRPKYGMAPHEAMAAATAGGGAGPPAAAPPGVPAEMPNPQAQPQPGSAVFKAVERQGRPHRHTVQFMAAVQPAAGSPPYEPQSGAAAGHDAARALGQPASQGPGIGVAPSGGSISVSSSILTSGQAKFAGRLAELTGLDPRVVSAWELAEESGGAAQAREAAGNFNWLNIGYFDSGAGKIAFDKAFGDPVTAAEQTADFLKGKWGGASPGIRAILDTVGKDPQQQMSAIANSGWASSHYGGGANLRATFDELGGLKVTRE
ncbi:MAG: hypothetical protein ACXVVQ_10530 [Solirubrobacteraceae bacterium]